jgi:hypothetical protein
MQFRARALRRRLHFDQAGHGALQFILGPGGILRSHFVEEPTHIRENATLRLAEDFRIAIGGSA